MDGPRDYYTMWSKSDRQRQISSDITYMWNLKYDTNGLIYKPKKTHRHRKQAYTYQKGQGNRGGTDQEFGIRRYKLCIK